MRALVPQRQILVIDASISAALGLGLAADQKMPTIHASSSFHPGNPGSWRWK
jgi:hypothetical protein